MYIKFVCSFKVGFNHFCPFKLHWGVNVLELGKGCNLLYLRLPVFLRLIDNNFFNLAIIKCDCKSISPESPSTANSVEIVLIVRFPEIVLRFHCQVEVNNDVNSSHIYAASKYIVCNKDWVLNSFKVINNLVSKAVIHFTNESFSNQTLLGKLLDDHLCCLLVADKYDCLTVT